IRFEQMRSFGHLSIHPVLQSHWRDTITAMPRRLAVWFKSCGNTVHQLERAASARRDVGNGRGAQTTVRRGSDNALVNLNGSKARIQRVALGGDRGQLLVELALERLYPALKNFFDFTRLELTSFLQT